MNRILSVILTCSLVMGILFFDMPVSCAEEVSTHDLKFILDTYFSDVSDSTVSDILEDTSYYVLQVVDYEGLRHYILDTFSVSDVSNWHFVLSSDNETFYTPFQGNSDYFITLDNLNLSGAKAYNLVHSEPLSDISSIYSGYRVTGYSFTGSSVFISSSADPRFSVDCYAHQSTSTIVDSSGFVFVNPYRPSYMTLNFVLANTNLVNDKLLSWSDTVDTNFTDISVTDDNVPSLNISWANSVYNSQLNYHYSEIVLSVFFDDTLSFKTFDSINNPDLFIDGQNINIPFSFIVDVSDLANNIDLFSRISLTEVVLNQYGRVNDNASDVKGSCFTLVNLQLYPYSGSSYDDNYFQGVEPDSVFNDRPLATNVIPVSYTYDYSGNISNILEHYPSGEDWYTAFILDFNKYVPEWADICLIDNSDSFSDGTIKANIDNRIDAILDNLDLFDNKANFKISTVSGSASPEDAFSDYTQYFSEINQPYFTDVAIFVYFSADYITATTFQDTTVYVWWVFTNRYYQKVKDQQILDVFTDYSSQLKDIADATLNDYYNNYSLYTYIHSKLDDMQRNQINYFGTTTGLFNNLNDSMIVIDSHLGDILSYLDSIDNKLSGTFSVVDSAVLSLLGDILTAIGNIETGGGDVTVTDEESPYTFQVFFPYLEGFEGDSDSATVSDNLLPDNVKGFLDRHYQTIYTVYSGIFGSLYKVMDIDDTGNLDSNELGSYRLAVDKFFNAVNLTYIDRSVEYSTGDNVPVNYYPDGFSRILRRSFDLTTMDGGQ